MTAAKIHELARVVERHARTDGRVETFKLPRQGARPCSVAVDRSGNVWYADISGYVGMLPMQYARR